MQQGLLSVDWRAVKKWCVLGTIAMVCWLMFPVARCSIQAFREEPLPEATPHDATGAREKAEEPGFTSRMGTAISACYKRTPLLGQEDYKTYLLFGFASLAVIAGAIAYWEAGRRKTYDRDQ